MYFLLNRFFVLALLLCCWGCQSRQVDSLAAYTSYLNQADNGLLQSIQKGGVKLSVKYLPAPYLAFREMSQAGIVSQVRLDSLQVGYNATYTFQLDLEATNGADLQALLHQRSSSPAQISQNLYRVHHQMDELVSLQLADTLLRPVLFNLENAPGMNQKMSFTFVFVRPTPAIPQALRFVLEDPIFLTGHSELVFEAHSLNELPNIHLKN